MNKNEILTNLVDIGAISVNTKDLFTWSSGILSPIYCDNRKSIGHYELRKEIANHLVAMIRKHFPQVSLIGGTATAGIPHATSVADKLELGMVYFRSKPKEHGKKSAIEGDHRAGQHIVIVEDLISTGGSVLNCVAQAREAGLNVLGVVAIFSYQLAIAAKRFDEANVPYYALLTFKELAEVMQLSEADTLFLENWRKNLS